MKILGASLPRLLNHLHGAAHAIQPAEHSMTFAGKAVKINGGWQVAFCMVCKTLFLDDFYSLRLAASRRNNLPLGVLALG
jgi:hypothetical protein